MEMELALIDGNGPFFRGYEKRRINWSKIPFAWLAEADARRWAEIGDDLALLAGRVRELGYNGLTLDDVAHLVDHPWYEPEVRGQIGRFREGFRRLFARVRAAGLRVYVTSDYLATSPAIDARLAGREVGAVEWFREMVERFLEEFPEVEGVVLRIGESDGVDVRDPLRSRILLKTADQVNRMLRTLLPVFEKAGRRLIFRTWTVGSYLIGDMIWNRGRLGHAMRGIDSPAFVLSMKYGESDFFRYLPLNRQFFRLDVPKIIEFQARREYEGAGEYPSFIGWDCERYARELAGARNVIGFSVWCQTGGWHGFRRLAFLQPEAVWIELNVAVAARVLIDRMAVEDAVAGIFGAERAREALEFLRLSEGVIRELLYIEEFARLQLFFRRVRIPPLIHVYWDCVFVNDPVREVVRHLVRDPERAIREGEAAFEHFGRMEVLAERLGLPVGDVRFMRDTFGLVLLARRYYLLPPDPELRERIRAAKKAYKLAWPRSVRSRYRIKTGFEPFPLKRRTFSWLMRLLVRRRQGYRTVLDRLFTLNVLSWCYRIFHRRHEEAMPKFLRKSAMGVESLFR